MRCEVWGWGFGPGVGAALHRGPGDADGVLAESPKSHDIQAEAEHLDAVFQCGFTAVDAGIEYGAAHHRDAVPIGGGLHLQVRLTDLGTVGHVVALADGVSEIAGTEGQYLHLVQCADLVDVVDGVGVLDERDDEEVAVVPFGVVDEGAVGVPGGAGGRADAAAAQRWKQCGVEDLAHVVGRFDLWHEQALGTGFHRASDGGFVRTARYAYQRHQADDVGGQDRVLDGTRVGRGMLGVQHDEVEAGQPQDFDHRAIAGKTLHSQRNLALLDHRE